MLLTFSTTRVPTNRQIREADTMDNDIEKLVQEGFGLNDLQLRRAVTMATNGGCADLGQAAGYVIASTSQAGRGRSGNEEIARRHARNMEAGARIAEGVYARNPDLAAAIASSIDNAPRIAL